MAIAPTTLERDRARAGGRRGRPRRRFLWWVLAAGVGLVGLGPTLVAHSPLRDVALRLALSDLDGTVASGGATLGWFSPIAFRNVTIADSSGTTVATLARIGLDRSLAGLIADRRDLGTLVCEGPRLNVVTRAGGSNVEDILRPLLASESAAAPVNLDVRIENGEIAIRDTVANEEWTVGKVSGSFEVRPDAPVVRRWLVQGAVTQPPGGAPFSVGTIPLDKEGKPVREPVADGTILRGATDEMPASSKPETVTVNAERLPAAMFGWLASRLSPGLRMSGEVSVGLAWEPPAEVEGAGRLHGAIAGQDVAVTGLTTAGETWRLKRLEMPLDVSWTRERLSVRQWDVKCDAGEIAATGEVPWASLRSGESPLELLRATFRAQGSVDLAEVARIAPAAVNLRRDSQIQSGKLKFSAISREATDGHDWEVQLETADLAARTAGKDVRWESPLRVDAVVKQTKLGPSIDKLRCEADFLKLEAHGNLDEFAAEGTFDLDRLSAEVGQIVDLTAFAPAGKGQARLTFKRDAEEAFRLTAAAQVSGLRVKTPGGQVWREENLSAELQSSGRMRGERIARLETAVLKGFAGGEQSGGDAVDVQISQPVAEPGNGEATWPLLLHASGDVARWQARLAPFAPVDGFDLRGNANVYATVRYAPAGTEIQSLKGAVLKLHAWGPDLFIDEPEVQFEASGRYDPASRRIELAKAVVLSHTLSVQTERASIALPSAQSLGFLGKVAFQANLEKLQRWTFDPAAPPQLTVAGLLGGQAELNLDGRVTAAAATAKIDELVVSGAAEVRSSALASLPPLRPAATRAVARTPLWREAVLRMAMEGKYDPAADRLEASRLSVESEALRVAARGEIKRWSDQRELDFAGQATFDWKALSPLLKPYLGEAVRLEGEEQRDFWLRGPLHALAGAAGGSAAPTPQDSLAWIKPLSAGAGVGWRKGELFGMPVGPGQIAGELASGVAKIEPIDLKVGEGRVRLSPQVLLTPGPMELLLERGKVIDRVNVTPEMTAGWLKYVAPAVAEATQTQGTLSLDLNGARVPLEQATRAELGGRLTIHRLEVTPGPAARELVLLAQQIRAITRRQAPPTEFTREPVLLRLADQEVDFRMAEGKVHHQGMELAIGDVMVRTRGWVGVDQSLGLSAEIPIRAEWVANDPVLKHLENQVITVPVGGTLASPRVDGRAVQELAGLLLRSAAQGAVEEQLNKQLERLFRPR